jgi:hypothetical protein
VLILLPPSEGKASEGSGPPVGELSFPALDKARKRVLNALTRASKRRDALDVLGLTPGLAGELAKNAALKTAPTLPAADLYTGVLYDNLGLNTLEDEPRRRAEESVLIFSGLWGVVRITDHIPPYRLSMGVNLPPLGGLATFWRPLITKALDRAPGLVVDLRSATYAGAWPRRPGAKSPEPSCGTTRLPARLTSSPRPSTPWATPSTWPNLPAPTGPGPSTSTSPNRPSVVTAPRRHAVLGRARFLVAGPSR